jgi:diguanylate cyclase (GGDEF)-like protein/PAS domain S-box-containing protein
VSTRRILLAAAEAETEPLRALLEAEGYAVTGLSGPLGDVVALAGSVHPDLALVAVGTPGEPDGIDLARALQETLGIPVVFLVADWAEDVWARALELEPYGCVHTPVAPGALRATLQLALRRHQRRVRRRAERERYRTLFQQNVAGVYRKSLGGILLQCNRSFAHMFGYDGPGELEGESMGMLYTSDADRRRFLDGISARGSVTNFELPMRRKDGTPIWVLENAVLLRDPSEGPTVVGTLIDITERKTLETHLKELANQDPLTGLANRRALEAATEHAIELAVRRRETGALLFLDLVRFKDINDTLGYRTGDQVLVETARRLTSALRSSDTAARVGGDEFVVLLSDVENAGGARSAGQRVVDRFERAVPVDGDAVQVRVRVGIALFPDHARTLTELMTVAGWVVSELKPETESVLKVFDPERATTAPST